MKNFYLNKIFSIENGKKLLSVLLLVVLGIYIGSRIVQIPKREEFVVIILALFMLPLLKHYRTGIILLTLIPPFIPLIRRTYYIVYARPETDILILIPDIILLLSFAGYLFASTDEKEENAFVAKVKSVLIIYLVFLLSRVFLFNTGTIGGAFLKFRYYGPFVLTFFLGVASVRDIRIIRRIGILTIAVGTVTALYGMKQLYIGYSDGEKLWLDSISFHSLFIGGLARPFSTLSSPATFADIQQIAIIATITAAAIASKLITKIALYGLVFLFIYAMLITSVRSSWIGALVGFLIWFLILGKQGNSARVSGIVLVVLFFFGSVFIIEKFEDHKTPIKAKYSTTQAAPAQQAAIDLLVKQRLHAVTNPLQEHSMNSRITTWKMIWAYSFSDPILAIFGRGLGRFSADSLYFTYLAEFGFPGMFFLFYILWLFIKGGLAVYDDLHDPVLHTIARGILTMNFVFLIINITGTHIHSFPGGFYFWFLNGVLLKIKDADKEHDNLPEHTTTVAV